MHTFTPGESTFSRGAMPRTLLDNYFVSLRVRLAPAVLTRHSKQSILASLCSVRMSEKVSTSSTPTVLALLFLLIILALALVYFYKKLNVDTNGQYTVQRIVFAPGGLRDRLRQGVGAVENRFGVHIWPQPRDDEENIGDNDEEDKEGGGHDKQNDSYAEEGEQRENDDSQDDSSSDYSSVDLRERAKMQMEEKKSDKNETVEEKEAAAGDEDKSEEVKNEEKNTLLVDLSPFRGSAIWSEENKDENDLTAL